MILTLQISITITKIRSAVEAKIRTTTPRTVLWTITTTRTIMMVMILIITRRKLQED